MRFIEILFFLIIIFIGVTFAFLNSEPVHINYYVGSRELPLSMIVVLTFLCGGLLGLLSAGYICLKLKCVNKRLRKRVSVAEKEIENLRTIPIRDEH